MVRSQLTLSDRQPVITRLVLDVQVKEKPLVANQGLSVKPMAAVSSRRVLKTSGRSRYDAISETAGQ